MTTIEHERLRQAHNGNTSWYRWGPYLSERQWGTVREDYSPFGNAWEFLPHDRARSQAYRWGEDGLLGICDDQCRLCFALSLWNEADPILKERLFGLTNSEGNHGEDVKEYYFFLDNTPTHSYMKALYKYPQRAFPYTDLVTLNRQRGKDVPEYELIDTGIFADDRYFDIIIEYAKVDPEDILIRISATNRGPETAPLHLLPTLWFRNTWAWGIDDLHPSLSSVKPAYDGGMGTYEPFHLVRASHQEMGYYWLACIGTPTLLFTENESNAERLWGVGSRSPFVKDGINDVIVHQAHGRVNPLETGTKMAAHYPLTIAPGQTQVVFLRLSAKQHDIPFDQAPELFARRQKEADAFYEAVSNAQTEDAHLIQRQALAGLLWSKQFYYYDVDQWLRGDPAGPIPPDRSRNKSWRHLSNADIILMPDTWEYPWYAAWDLAFHCVPMAMIDPEFAKDQLLLLLREHSMHPNGQLPAYEWAFSDVNPPVHAWAVWKIYHMEKEHAGQGDRHFLECAFHRLMLNFTWWVNRKDAKENNLFEGGFLGLDNIGVFDRNMVLPNGMTLEQSDGTAWMGFFCLTMFAIALELSREDRVYSDIAIKFLDHFFYVANAISGSAQSGLGLWDEEDGFFYDKLSMPDGRSILLKLRSLVGLIPLLAIETFERALIDNTPELTERLKWFAKNRSYTSNLLATWQDASGQNKDVYMLALIRGPRMHRLLQHMLDQTEFLSDYGIRSLSKEYEVHPYVLHTTRYGDLTASYAPAESTTYDFGGNSNWRGPIWFPINYLFVEALDKFHRFYGNEFQVEYPAGTGQKRNLAQVASDLGCRLSRIFLRNEQGDRPVFGDNRTFQSDPHWRDHLLFYEYFHGDTGRGVGASHQTGWTALVAELLQHTEN
jgi:Glycosyl hydrolase family 63 C-terminal domain